mgnify:CR=1 FL=1
MPDMKYSKNEAGRKYSGVSSYWDQNRKAVGEMHKQVGDLSINDLGIATRGLLIRHLVLPGSVAGSSAILEFIAEQISTDTYVNVMDQYRPTYQAREWLELNCTVSRQEYEKVVTRAVDLGLRRGISR